MYNRHKSIAEKLRTYRESCALSQRQVAEALNIERSTYTKYETGDSEPNLTTLVKIARIFGISPEVLLPQLETGDYLSTLGDKLRADSPIYQLSKDERSMVVFYRACSKEEKQYALEMMANLAKNSSLSERK